MQLADPDVFTFSEDSKAITAICGASTKDFAWLGESFPGIGVPASALAALDALGVPTSQFTPL